MTKEALKEKIAQKLRGRYAKKLKADQVWAWSLIKDAVRDASASEKQQIVSFLENSRIVREKLSQLADAEADLMLADNSLSLDELTKIIGD